METKKGAITSGLVTIFLYFGFILLLVIFFFVFKFTGKESHESLTGHIIDSEANDQILVFLRTPITFDDKETNLGGIIARYSMESDQQIKSQLKNIFVQEFNHDFNSGCNALCINSEKFESSECRLATSCLDSRHNSIFIPTDGGNLVQVYLSFDAEVVAMSPWESAGVR